MEFRKNAISHDLQHILEKLITLHRGLLDLLREEYAHMAVLDAKGMSEAAHAKEAVLSEIWSYEQLRIKEAERLARELKLNPASASLLNIAGASTEPSKSELLKCRTVLSMLMTEAKELNMKNMEFAESSLKRIELMKTNVLGADETQPKENYSNNGNRQPTPSRGGRILSTEA